MPVVAPQIHEQSVGEIRAYAVDFQGKLDTGELLTGTPTVTEVGTSDLTISARVINTSELTINGATVAIGEALQFNVVATGATVGKVYTILCQATTDNSQTLNGHIKVLIC
jgi:hypothetical protein